MRLGFPSNSGASTNTSIRACVVSGLTRGVGEGLRGGVSTSKSLSKVLEVRKEVILLRSFSIVIDRSYSRKKGSCTPIGVFLSSYTSAVYLFTFTFFSRKISPIRTSIGSTS